MNANLVSRAIPLASLQAGQVGVIVGLSGQVEEIRRLHELGIQDGVQVLMIRPGNPCIAKIGGQRVCFRPSDGLRVFVERAA